MTEHQIINHIRSVRRLKRIWQRLTNDQRRRVLFIADGDLWHIDEILEFVAEENDAAYQPQLLAA